MRPSRRRPGGAAGNASRDRSGATHSERLLEFPSGQHPAPSQPGHAPPNTSSSREPRPSRPPKTLFAQRSVNPACHGGATSGSRGRPFRGRRFRATPDITDTTWRGAEKRRHARSLLCACVKLFLSGLRDFCSIYVMRMKNCENKVEDRGSQLKKMKFQKFDSKDFSRLCVCKTGLLSAQIVKN